MVEREGRSHEAAPPSGDSAPRILFVDDDAAIRRAATRVLVAEGFDVVQASDGHEALLALDRGEFDVIVSDVAMPNMSGLELLRAIRQRDLELPVILVSGDPSAKATIEATKFGALQYLPKPVDNERLALAVSRAERLHRLAVTKRMAMETLGSTLPRAGDRAGLEQSLGRALDEMWMAYQPIVRVTGRALYGYEALMRTAEGSLPHPGAILDAAERLGRLHEVGRRSRSLAPTPMASAPENAVLFVNVHASDLDDRALTDPKSPLAAIAKRVVLEITERATLDGVAQVGKRIAALREIGFRIAIDDLGAGYAGLSSFALLEPEVVKLDMSLVRDVETTATKSKLIRSLCSVCRDLGVLVVAEGIETTRERDHLIELGCDLLQGYLFGRPGRAFPEFGWP
jgi:EAL domain-containing protein (putative c-di-GMP-specific phosphodiesterase class I)/FixJ family two-component response regulator